NGNTTTGFKSSAKTPKKLLNDLAQIKQVSKSDLKAFLTQDHTSFSVLSVSTKHIESTNRISVTLSKNSAQSFYLNQSKSTSKISFRCVASQHLAGDYQHPNLSYFFRSALHAYQHGMTLTYQRKNNPRKE
ncbi:5237_t:CDS:2, partial [Entrophospora sp. SA101]